jgi:hypothetical protein
MLACRRPATLEAKGGDGMRLTWKDGAAALLTAFAVLVFFAAHQSWDVWLIGSSNRWAAVAVTLLGAVTCGLGAASDELAAGREATTSVKLLSAVGAVTGVLAILAIVTGSLTMLSLLVLGIVVLWVGATLRHASHLGHTGHDPVAT